LSSVEVFTETLSLSLARPVPVMTAAANSWWHHNLHRIFTSLKLDHIIL